MAQFTPRPRAGYLVGGAVRDLLLGLMPKDFDWLVADPEAEARRAAEIVSASVFPLDLERGHWRVMIGETTSHDFIRQDGTLRQDLAQRDFTVNAMAFDANGELFDPFGGLRDVRARTLRLVRDDALERDPLRCWRALRFRATLQFSLSEETRSAIRACVAEQQGRLPMPAWERTREELDKLLASPRPAHVLLEAHELGLLRLYLPELAETEGVEQGGFHHLDVLHHSLEALNQLAQGFPEADLALRWAVLLHDIGKPASKSYDESGRYYHFYGHAKLGAEMAEALLTRLRYPERLVHCVSQLIHYHMLPLPGSEREARRFVHRRRELLPDLLKLMIADREAARGPLSSEGSRRAYRVALSRVLAILAEPPPKAPLLTGNEVMALLGLSPSPRVGEALRLVQEAEAVGDVHDWAEAEALLRNYAERQGWLEERAESDE